MTSPTATPLKPCQACEDAAKICDIFERQMWPSGTNDFPYYPDERHAFIKSKWSAHLAKTIRSSCRHADTERDAARYRCYRVQSPPPKSLDFATPEQRDAFYDAALDADGKERG